MKLFKFFILSLFLGLNFSVILSKNPINKDSGINTAWTWSFSKKITKEDSSKFSSKSEIIFSKNNLKKFTQLIFSWNAIRPTSGYLRFWVQAKDSKNNIWSDWHKMFDWGHNIQRSHNIKHIKDISYRHVRLEMENKTYSNGFKVKVSAHNGAKLENLKYINVSVSNLNDFKLEPIRSLDSLIKSIKIKNIPFQSQMVLRDEDADRMCSPTSMSMLVGYLLKKKLDALGFARKSYDVGLDSYGSWPFNTAHAFEVCPEFNFKVVRLNSFKDLYKNLTKNLPVVVSVRGKILGAAKVYENGHLILVIGYDAKKRKVICHDPAMPNSRKVLTAYGLADFLRAWERSRRLAYVIDY